MSINSLHKGEEEDDDVYNNNNNKTVQREREQLQQIGQI